MERPVFLHVCAACSKIPSYMYTIARTTKPASLTKNTIKHFFRPFIHLNRFNINIGLYTSSLKSCANYYFLMVAHKDKFSRVIPMQKLIYHKLRK